MRTTQYVEGIQLAFETPSRMKESLRALAKRLKTTLKDAPAKDTSIQPNGGLLYEMRKGGLVLCVCPDRWKSGDTIRVTIPYIIVHGKKVSSPESLYMAEDDGTGEDALVEFINASWTDNLEDVQPIKPKRRVKCLNGKFPKMLIDIACTLEELYAMGLSTDGLPKDIADYEMAVWLRKLAGDTLKDAEKYYAFLDRARRRSDESEFNKADYDDAVIKLETNYNKIYTFLDSYNFLLPPKEA